MDVSGMSSLLFLNITLTYNQGTHTLECQEIDLEMSDKE